MDEQNPFAPRFETMVEAKMCVGIYGAIVSETRISER